MRDALTFVVRTPHGELLQRSVSSLRVPTETGSVGFRARAERTVLVVEPGVVVAQGDGGRTLVGTAGGLLHVERDAAVLLTPLAVAGETSAAITAKLAELSAEPSAEADLRRCIERLERGLLAESSRRLRRTMGRARVANDGAATAPEQAR